MLYYSFKILQSSKHAYLQFKKNKPGVWAH